MIITQKNERLVSSAHMHSLVFVPHYTSKYTQFATKQKLKHMRQNVYIYLLKVRSGQFRHGKELYSIISSNTSISIYQEKKTKITIKILKNEWKKQIQMLLVNEIYQNLQQKTIADKHSDAL